MTLTPLQIIITAVYFGVLVSYATVTSGEKNKTRFFVKLSLCLLYLAFAVINQVMADSALFAFVIATLCLCCAGDIILTRKGKKFFAAGSCFFLFANILLVITQIFFLAKLGVQFSQIWYCLIPATLLLVVFVLGTVKKVVIFGKLLPLLCVYVTAVTTSGCLGFSLIIAGVNTSLTLLGIGAMLFMISDYLLAFARFAKKRPAWAQILNSITYFSGMYFVALSLTGVL